MPKQDNGAVAVWNLLCLAMWIPYNFFICPVGGVARNEIVCLLKCRVSRSMFNVFNNAQRRGRHRIRIAAIMMLFSIGDSVAAWNKEETTGLSNSCSSLDTVDTAVTKYNPTPGQLF